VSTVTITFANEITADVGNNAEKNSCAPSDPILRAGETSDNAKIDNSAICIMQAHCSMPL